MVRLYPLLLGMLILLLLPPLVQARPEYAQTTQKRCKACHVRTGDGTLNDEGKAFRKSIYMQKGITPPAEQKKPRPETAKEKEETEEAGPMAKKERPRKKMKQWEESEEDESEEEEPVEEPEPPKTVIYRWMGKDGSIVFSERPAPPIEKGEKPGRTKNRKVSGPAKTAARMPKKQTAGAKSPTSSKPAPAAPEVAAVVKQTFAECMESELVDRPEPASSEELMNILIESRNKCSAYEKGRMFHPPTHQNNN